MADAVIYKYAIAVRGGNQYLQIPHGSEVLSAQTQDGVLCVWAEVPTPAGSLYSILVSVMPTGSPFSHPQPMRFVDTVQEGRSVWHVYVQADFWT